MNKTALAIALALTSTAALAEGPQFYGRVWLGATISNNGLATKEKVDGVALENYASRLGIKGSTEIHDGLSLIYQMEIGANLYDEDNKNDPFNARDSFLGLKGHYGQVKAGRINTALKTSEGPVDLFNATNADMSYMLAGQDRLSDHLLLQSAQYKGFSAALSYVLEDDFGGSAQLEDANNYALSLAYGDKGFKQGNLFASVTYADGLNGIDALRAVAAYRLGQWQFGALVQDTDSLKYDQLGGLSALASVGYRHDKHHFKAQYIWDESGLGKVISNAAKANEHELGQLADARIHNLSLGYEYHLSRALMVGAQGSYYDGDYQQGGSTTELDDTVFTLHTRYLF